MLRLAAQMMYGFAVMMLRQAANDVGLRPMMLPSAN
jgi:hypothetical protein